LLAYEFATAKKRPLIISASLKAQAEGAQPICAVLPSGNANDHARTMHSEPLGELIVRGKVTELDVLRVTALGEDGTEVSRFAHSYTGVGLTPTVAVELNKHTLNTLKEAWIVIRTFWHYRPVTIIRRGKTSLVDSIICSTIPAMAKVLTISKKANPRDGQFEVAIFRHHRKASLAFRLIKGFFTYLGAQYQTDEFTFTLVAAAPMQIDGEVMALDKNTKVTVSICPRLLRTLASV
jgi:diacylglycerol kinase family enzyme